MFRLYKEQNHVTDKDRIAEILRAYMLRPQEQKSSILVEIRLKKGVEWNGREIPGGLIIEGARPLSATTEVQTGETTFSFTNSDSGYTQPIGSAKLSDIVSILELD